VINTVVTGTIRKVSGSILDVIGFSYGLNPSSNTMALESTQHVTGMSARILTGEVKAAGA
jgi:hypothetical protein